MLRWRLRCPLDGRGPWPEEDRPRRHHGHDRGRRHSNCFLQCATNDSWADHSWHWKWHQHFNGAGLANRNLGSEVAWQTGCH